MFLAENVLERTMQELNISSKPNNILGVDLCQKSVRRVKKQDVNVRKLEIFLVFALFLQTAGRKASNTDKYV